MERKIVRYRTKPDMADTNQRLIEAVFRELQAKAPAGVQYAALRLADGSFVHLVQGAGDLLPKLDAFSTFLSALGERCIEPPQRAEVTVVGNYRMLAE